jgi:hypothetical protein
MAVSTASRHHLIRWLFRQREIDGRRKQDSR